MRENLVDLPKLRKSQHIDEEILYNENSETFQKMEEQTEINFLVLDEKNQIDETELKKATEDALQNYCSTMLGYDKDLNENAVERYIKLIKIYKISEMAPNVGLDGVLDMFSCPLVSVPLWWFGDLLII